jgi:hypothetical protein
MRYLQAGPAPRTAPTEARSTALIDITDIKASKEWFAAEPSTAHT